MRRCYFREELVVEEGIIIILTQIVEDAQFGDG